MSYCASCGCPVEISKDARVGFEHACRHRHEHRVPFTISEAQRARLLPYFGRSRGEASEVPA